MTINLNRRSLLINSAAITAIGLSGCSVLKHDQSAELKTLIDRITKETLLDSPETVTSFNLPISMLGENVIGKSSNRSKAAEEARNKMVAGWIAELEKIKQSNLEGDDKLTQSIMLSASKYSNNAAKFGYGDAGYGAPNPYIVSQLTGAYVGYPDFLDSIHPVKTHEDAEGYISRLDGFAVQIKDETQRLNEDAAKGVIAPDFIIKTALEQLDKFLSIKPEETVLVSSIVGKLKEAKLEPKDYSVRATAIVKDKILPAYSNLKTSFEVLLKKANSDAGVWKLPQGDEYYKAALAYWTTTTKTPTEIHELGKSIVQSLGVEIDKSLKEIGYTEGSLAQRIEKLTKDPKYVYPNNEAGKTKLLADINVKMNELKALLPDVFATLPKADCEVKRVPSYTEAGAPGGYYIQPAPDGSRPGAYYINLRDTAAWPSWSLPTLTYHEAVPGHHNQIALAQEAQGLPFIRSKMLWFGAYGEGWALYAETLADELGVYKNDKPGRIGYLQSMAFRAARCVVDTGIHAMKWTKQQAIDYMVEATGDTYDSIETEVERYCVWPGQATCYMVGRVKIMEIRDAAKKALGEKFDIKAFHDKILLSGAMPLDVLEQVITDWVKSVK